MPARASPPGHAGHERNASDAELLPHSRAGHDVKRRAVAGLSYICSSSCVALLARRLASTSPELRFRAHLLPALGFLLVSIGAALPRWIPHLSARLGLNGSAGIRAAAGSWQRVALVALSAAGAASCALDLPNLVSIEAEQAISHFAAPVVLLLAPFVLLSSSTDRLQYTTMGISAFLGYALLAESISGQGALSAAFKALCEGVLAVSVARWLAVTSRTSLLAVYSPIAGVLSLMRAFAATRQAWPGVSSYQTLDHWIRYRPPTVQHDSGWYAAFVLAFVAEQVALVNALQVFSSPLHLTLLALPRALIIFLATRHLYGQHSMGLAFVLGAGVWLWSDEEASPVHLWQARHAMQPDLPIHNEKAWEAQDTALEPQRSQSGASKNALRVLASLLPFAFFLLRALQASQDRRLDPYDVSTRVVTPGFFPSLDLVFAYYDHDIHEFASHITYLRNVPPIAERQPRVIVYTKSRPDSLSGFAAQLGADEVYVLPNIGREGHTYLDHIVRNYGRGPDPHTHAGGLADQTAFCQDHLSWHGVAEERLKLLTTETGYLHFAPYVANDCGLDMENKIAFPRMRDIYTIFREEICPPTLQLSAWSAQFFVSKKRILSNPLSKYRQLTQILEAPSGHWLHNDTGSSDRTFAWGGEGFGPDNPYIGHALERSWPVIFQCNDPKIAERCDMFTWETELCQCFDR